MKVILRAETKIKSFEFELEVFHSAILGRSSECQFRVDDDRVSARHCRFELKHDRLEITDLESKNGVYLNGIRIEAAEIFIGDEIKVGSTSITLRDDKMSEDSVSKLTFPGPHRERIDYELKADFTGVRIQNQIFNKAHPEEFQQTNSHVREIAIRQRAESTIRLSKEEIKLRNKNLERIAIALDTLIMFAICFLPFMFLNDYNKENFFSLSLTEYIEWKSHIIGGIELFIIITYMTLNRTAKFTLGEKLAGLEEKYLKQ